MFKWIKNKCEVFWNKFLTWLRKIGIMSSPVYCLKRKKSTGTLHLFECVKTITGCNCNNLSICKKMEKSEMDGSNIFTCKDEDTARLECMLKAREVCGDCIGHLYAKEV